MNTPISYNLLQLYLLIISIPAVTNDLQKMLYVVQQTISYPQIFHKEEQIYEYSHVR